MTHHHHDEGQHRIPQATVHSARQQQQNHSILTMGTGKVKSQQQQLTKSALHLYSSLPAE
jgi:hypothetical protein